MRKEGFSPDVVTFMTILKACASIGAIDKGKQIHDEIVAASLLNDDVLLGTALVDMYAQCGMFSRAKRILSELPNRNVVAWNALMAGYARRGRCDEAFECFEHMQDEGGLLPDAVTFLCLMNACSHSGLLEKAEMHFHEMRDKHGVVPSVEHYTCMVAMLGFGGQFGKAVSAIKMMPFSGSRPVWLALLAGCRKWGNVKLGRWAFDQIMHLDNTCTSAYVLMISIYTNAAMHEAVEEVVAMRRRCDVPANLEMSFWVDTSGYAHPFSIQ
jgi:pentatricopeptide repeat protein